MEKTEQKNFRKCEYCHKTTLWQWNGKKLRDGSKIYLDAKGQRWAGKRCAVCEKKRVQTAIRFNRFDRMAITKKLEAEGYIIKKFANPMVVEREGKTYYLPIRKAYTDGKAITIEAPFEEEKKPAESFLLVFSASRIFTKEQMERISSSDTLQVFH